jgi:hypothetical protein
MSCLRSIELRPACRQAGGIYDPSTTLSSSLSDLGVDDRIFDPADKCRIFNLTFGKKHRPYLFRAEKNENLIFKV